MFFISQKEKVKHNKFQYLLKSDTMLFVVTRKTNGKGKRKVTSR